MDTCGHTRIWNPFSGLWVRSDSDLGNRLRDLKTKKYTNLIFYRKPDVLHSKKNLIDQHQLTLNDKHHGTYETYRGIYNTHTAFFKSSQARNKKHQADGTSVIEVESAIHKTILNNLLEKTHTPHLIKYFDRLFYCENGQEHAFLVLEFVDGQSLNETLQYHKHFHVKDLVAVVVQTAYTLKVLAKVRLTHNDMHTHNVIVEEKKSEHTTFYKTREEGKFQLSSKFFVRILDWERATTDTITVPENSRLNELCPDIVCDYAPDAFFGGDYFYFLCRVLRLLTDNLFKHEVPSGGDFALYQQFRNLLDELDLDFGLLSKIPAGDNNKVYKEYLRRTNQSHLDMNIMFADTLNWAKRIVPDIDGCDNDGQPVYKPPRYTGRRPKRFNVPAKFKQNKSDVGGDATTTGQKRPRSQTMDKARS